jgi:hypothetical protein
MRSQEDQQLINTLIDHRRRHVTLLRLIEQDLDKARDLLRSKHPVSAMRVLETANIRILQDRIENPL